MRMVYVSRNRMRPRVKKRVDEILQRALFKTRRGERIFGELLSVPEKTQLAKRFAIIVMLEHRHSSYEISRLLKVSVATVLAQRRSLRSGRYSLIQREIAVPRSSGRDFLETIEVLLAAGIPAIAGPRHNRRLRALRRK